MALDSPAPGTQQLGGPPPAPPNKAMTKTAKILLGGGAGLFVLMLICCAGVIAAVGSAGKPDAAASPPAAAIAAASPPSAAPSASPTLPPAPSPTPSPMAQLPADKVYSGRGDKVLKLPQLHEEYHYIAKITHSGSSNFAVKLRGSGGEYLDLLVNEIGRYSGTRPLSFRDYPAAMEINADGSWKVTVQVLQKALRWNGAVLKGKADNVYLVPAGVLDGLAALKITHSGRSNFAIWAYGDSGRDLLVNEVGKYSGEVLVSADTAVLEITADGAWSIQKS